MKAALCRKIAELIEDFSAFDRNQTIVGCSITFQACDSDDYEAVYKWNGEEFSEVPHK